MTGKMIFPSPPSAGVLEPSLLNQWQEEIATVIESAGITLDELKRDQLLTAIKQTNRVMAAKTINVPGDFANVTLALDSLKSIRIDPGMDVVIQLGAVTHPEVTAPIIMDHVDGANIVIRGNIGTPASHTLNFNFTGAFGSADACIKVGHNSGLRIEGVTLQNVGPVGIGRSYIKAERGAFLHTIMVNTLSNLRYGYYLESGATARIESGTMRSDFGCVTEDQAYAYISSTAFIGSGLGVGAEAFNDYSIPSSIGIWARYGGVIWAEYVSVTQFAYAGVSEHRGFLQIDETSFSAPLLAQHQGYLRGRELGNSFASGGDHAAYTAATGGVMELYNADVSGNVVMGYRARTLGKIVATLGSIFSAYHGCYAEQGGEAHLDGVSISGAYTGLEAYRGGSIFFNGTQSVLNTRAGGTSYMASFGGRIIGQNFTYGAGAWGFQTLYGSQIIATGSRTLGAGQAAPTSLTINNTGGYIYPA